MVVLVHRETVGEVDDRVTPSPKAIHVPEGTTLVEFLRIVRERGYLPDLPGGRATWVCEGEIPLAIVAQEYRDPWLVSNPIRPIVQIAGSLPRPHFFFRHLAGEVPEEAFRRLGGDPVRLPREAWEPSKEISWTDGLRQLFAPRRRRSLEERGRF